MRAFALVCALLAAGPAQAELQARDLTGDGIADAYYDTAQNITWLADTGPWLGWVGAQAYTQNLVVGGIGGWRLPHSVPIATPGCYIDSIDLCGYQATPEESELAHLHFVTFGYDYNGYGSYAPFSSDYYRMFWTGAGLVFYGGGQYRASLSDCTDPDRCFPFSAWAVRDGDVLSPVLREPRTYALLMGGDVLSPIPEPSTYALLAFGLLLVLTIAKSRVVNK